MVAKCAVRLLTSIAHSLGLTGRRTTGVRSSICLSCADGTILPMVDAVRCPFCSPLVLAGNERSVVAVGNYANRSIVVLILKVIRMNIVGASSSDGNIARSIWRCFCRHTDWRGTGQLTRDGDSLAIRQIVIVRRATAQFAFHIVLDIRIAGEVKFRA